MQRTLGKFTLTFFVVLAGALSLLFGLEFLMSHTSGQNTPGQGVEDLNPSLTGGYDVGVQVEVNGVVREVDAGDVVFTGTVNEIDRGALLAAALAGVTETATALQLVFEAAQLPAGYCDFGNLSLGASFSSDIVGSEEGASYSEKLGFAVNDDCEVSFVGKDVVEERPEPEPQQPGNGFSSFLGGGVASAQNLREPDGSAPIRGIYACRNNAEGTGRSTLEGVTRAATKLSGSTAVDPNATGRGRITVAGLVRVEDKELAHDGDGDPSVGAVEGVLGMLQNDCTPFRTETEVEFGYNSDGEPILERYRGKCRNWNLSISDITPIPSPVSLPGAIPTPWSIHILLFGSAVPIWDVASCNRELNLGTALDASAKTVGVYQPNARNLLIASLDAANIGHTGLRTGPDANGNYEYKQFELSAGAELDVTSEPRINYQCDVDELIRVELAVPTGYDDEFFDLNYGAYGLVPSTFLRIFSDIDKLKLPDDGAIDSYLECHVEFSKSAFLSRPHTLAPVLPERPTPPPPPADTRSPASEQAYVNAFFPNATFTRSESFNIVTPLFSVERSFAQPDIEVDVYNYDVVQYNYEVPAYNYRNRTVNVYNYETRRRTVDVFNYETRERTVPAYNYATRTIPAYNYVTHRSFTEVYNYETRYRTRYRTEERRGECIRWRYFLGVRTWCREYEILTVSVPYQEAYQVRVAPYTELRTWRERVAPFTREVRERVAPYTRTETYSERVAPFTRTETYRVRVAPYTEVRSERVAPFTRIARFSERPADRTAYPDTARVQPFVVRRTFTGPQSGHGYTRVEPRTEVRSQPPEWRTMRVEEDDIIEVPTAAHPEIDRNIVPAGVRHSPGGRRTVPATYSTGTRATDADGNRINGWSGVLGDLRSLRSYDQTSVIGDSTKITTLEALRMAISADIEVGPNATGNTATLTQFKAAVQHSNQAAMPTRAARNDYMRSDLITRFVD